MARWIAAKCEFSDANFTKEYMYIRSFNTRGKRDEFLMSDIDYNWQAFEYTNNYQTQPYMRKLSTGVYHQVNTSVGTEWVKTTVKF